MLDIRAFDVTTGQRLEEHRHGPVVLPPNRSTELLDILLPGQDSIHSAKQIVVALRLMQDGYTIARFVSWPEPLKSLTFDKSLGIIEVKLERNKAVVKVEKPVKGFELIANVEGVMWEDNGVDLVPGEEVELGVVGLQGDEVKARWYGHEEAVAIERLGVE